MELNEMRVRFSSEFKSSSVGPLGVRGVLKGAPAGRSHGGAPLELLVGEEGLGLSTGGVGAEGAAEGQLAGARLVGLQVGLDQVC